MVSVAGKLSFCKHYWANLRLEDFLCHEACGLRALDSLTSMGEGRGLDISVTTFLSPADIGSQ